MRRQLIFRGVTVLGGLLALALARPAAGAATPAAAVTATPKAAAAATAQPAAAPLVQIALLLDTSNSMDGLINQAKTQLWTVVNGFVTAKKDGRAPEVQVALYEYGKPTLGAETNYIRQVLPLTSDLDRVSEELFKLTTNGGDEYCGAVIRRATEDLAWSKSAGDLKAIFIAGNEPFTQGPIDYHESCRAAIARGICVNTIHCGSDAEGRNGEWQNGALLADGAYTIIDQNQPAAPILVPQDQRLAELSTELNRTYVAYGAQGSAGSARQAAQDANAAAAAPGSAASRAMTKANAQYRNDTWDLVDAVNNGTVKLEEVKNEDLPAELQKLSLEEQRKLIAAKTAERKQAQEEINRLSAERDQYVAAEQTRRAAAAGKAAPAALDSAMGGALRARAEKLSFEFAPPPPPPAKP